MTQDCSLIATTGVGQGRRGIDPMLCILISGVVAGAGYVCYWLLFELLVMPTLVTPDAPMLSYVQQFGVMTVVAFFVGCSVGASLVSARWWLTSIALLFPIFFTLAISNLWSSNFAVYGADPSDWIVFVPVVVGSAVCIPLNIVLSIVVYRRRASCP